jgi:hypothetical protein
MEPQAFPEFGAWLRHILFRVPGLHQFPRPRDGLHIGEVVGGEELGGVLRVLAVFGGDEGTTLGTCRISGKIRFGYSSTEVSRRCLVREVDRYKVPSGTSRCAKLTTESVQLCGRR